MVLTSKQRLVFNLVRIQGKPQNQVAESLGLGKAAVSRLLTRADERLEGFAKSCGNGVDCGILRLLTK